MQYVTELHDKLSVKKVLHSIIRIKHNIGMLQQQQGWILTKSLDGQFKRDRASIESGSNPLSVSMSSWEIMRARWPSCCKSFDEKDETSPC